MQVNKCMLCIERMANKQNPDDEKSQAVLWESLKRVRLKPTCRRSIKLLIGSSPLV
jgi:hypothetical protein